MKRFVGLVVLGLASTAVLAKLPPLSDEAKAKAAEAAAKAAHATQLDTFRLCKAMDRVAEAYHAQAKNAGKASTPTATPACTEPGPFVYTPPEAKPLEAAGAHSPPATATSPPSTKTPAAEQAPAKKT